MPRDELESGLSLLALLLFRNELKPDTAEAVLNLKAGQVSLVLPVSCPALPCPSKIQVPGSSEPLTSSAWVTWLYMQYKLLCTIVSQCCLL